MSVVGRREGGGVCSGMRGDGEGVDGGTSEGVILHLPYVAFGLLDYDEGVISEGVDVAVVNAVHGP